MHRPIGWMGEIANFVENSSSSLLGNRLGDLSTEARAIHSFWQRTNLTGQAPDLRESLKTYSTSFILPVKLAAE